MQGHDRAALAEAEAGVHRHATSTGVSCVEDFLVIKRAQLLEQFMGAVDFSEVAKLKGRIEGVDELLRVIRTGPHVIPEVR